MGALLVALLLASAAAAACLGYGYGSDALELAAVLLFAAGLWALLIEAGALR